MTDVYPLFADRPELDAAFSMMQALHSHLPERARFSSWSDFPEDQVSRAKAAAALVYDEATERAARRASYSGFGFDCGARGVQDPETGETPCSMEDDGNGYCLCSERHQEAHAAGGRVRHGVLFDTADPPPFLLDKARAAAKATGQFYAPDHAWDSVVKAILKAAALA